MAPESPSVSQSSSTKNLIETYQKVQKVCKWIFVISLILGVGCLLAAYFTKGKFALTFKATLYTGTFLGSSAGLSLIVMLACRYLKGRAERQASLNKTLTQPEKTTSSSSCSPPSTDSTDGGDGSKPPLKIGGDGDSPKILKKDPPEKKARDIKKANETLATVKDMLDTSKDIEVVEEAEKLLEKDHNLHQFFLSNPRETPKNPTPTDEEKVVNHYNTLLTRIHSFKDSYYYHSVSIKKNGEVEVKGKGDCLFLAILLGLSRPATEESAKKERGKTVEWMRGKYKEDKTLQSHLIKSLSEYYLNKQETLKGEKMAVELILKKPKELNSDEKQECENRNKLLPTELEKVEKILKRIGEVEGEGHEKGDITKIEDILNEYFDEMSQSGKYAGHAEIYALSCRHERCVIVYVKRSEEEIEKKPFLTPFNDQYSTMEKPAISLSKDPVHYNLYFPEDSKSST